MKVGSFSQGSSLVMGPHSFPQTLCERRHMALSYTVQSTVQLLLGVFPSTIKPNQTAIVFHEQHRQPSRDLFEANRENKGPTFVSPACALRLHSNFAICCACCNLPSLDCLVRLCICLSLPCHHGHPHQPAKMAAPPGSKEPLDVLQLMINDVVSCAARENCALLLYSIMLTQFASPARPDGQGLARKSQG
jgi:hypothetical protein